MHSCHPPLVQCAAGVKFIQMKLSGLAQNDKFQIQFSLTIPIKNFNRQTSRDTELQTITLLPFDSHKLLCPVRTLKAYLLKTAPVRKKVGIKFLYYLRTRPDQLLLLPFLDGAKILLCVWPVLRHTLYTLNALLQVPMPS